ncbi:MAG: TetR/AcrR family transcriptional regulator [Myxococcota bacterium]
MARPRLISDEQILATMRASVLEHGPHVSLDAVAGKLKVTGPALLKRFGSRRALLIRALRPPDNPELLSVLAREPDGRPLDEQLAAVLGGLWDFVSEVLPCIAALRESGIPHEEVFDKRRDSPGRFVKQLQRWLELARDRGLVEGDGLEAAATAMLGAVQTRIFTAHVAKEQLTARHRREYLKDLTQFFTRALTPTGRRARNGAD